MSQETARATPTPHEHAAVITSATSDEYGTRTVYTCACGAFKVIERFPSGCWRNTEWAHPESTRAG